MKIEFEFFLNLYILIIRLASLKLQFKESSLRQLGTCFKRGAIKCFLISNFNLSTENIYLYSRWLLNQIRNVLKKCFKDSKSDGINDRKRKIWS